MIGLRVTVPIACWRKGHARELLETEVLPPPATCYGALLALVGESDRERHRGCRVTSGLLQAGERSVVLRTLWQIKEAKVPQGSGVNAGPDFQQLLAGSDIMIWCDSREESDSGDPLEARVTRAIRQPGTTQRFGGWSLGESTHLINDAWLQPDGTPPTACQAFLLHAEGSLTLPVWVDHVGSAGTVYAVGALRTLAAAPSLTEMPRIPPAEPPVVVTGRVPRRS